MKILNTSQKYQFQEQLEIAESHLEEKDSQLKTAQKELRHLRKEDTQVHKLNI